MNGYDRWVRRTDAPLLWLAVAFLVVLLLPVIVHLAPWQRTVLTGLTSGIWLAFALDYAARLFLTSSRWHFVRTHVLDLVVIALPMLRPLRLLRLARVARIARVASLLAIANRQGQRSLHARVSAYVAVTAVVVIGASAVAMVDAERGAQNANITSLADALWWAVTTVSTVGYGDRYPTTGLGRAIGASLMLVGIALLGVLTASVAAYFVSHLKDVQESEARTEATLDDVLAELREVQARLDHLGH